MAIEQHNRSLNIRTASPGGVKIPPYVLGFVRSVVSLFAPEKIILFGSLARGTAGPDADVDLLIVMPHEGHPARLAAEIVKKVRKSFPLDLIVRSPEKLNERLQMGDPFLSEVMEEGVVLYESARC